MNSYVLTAGIDDTSRICVFMYQLVVVLNMTSLCFLDNMSSIVSAQRFKVGGFLTMASAGCLPCKHLFAVGMMTILIRNERT